MGLDFSHCDAHWSYSGFHNFRHRLAAQIGINLDQMQGYTHGEHWTPWGTVDDDIVPLLNHSDCEGSITPNVCRRVASRLRQLVKDWPEDDRDKRNALELADGMELAAKERRRLLFQ